jgi:hypothetical protein
MSSAWAGGTDAIIERMDKMTELFIKQKGFSIESLSGLKSKTSSKAGGLKT